MEEKEHADELASEAADKIVELLEHLDNHRFEPWSGGIFLAFAQATASCLDTCRLRLREGLQARLNLQ